MQSSNNLIKEAYAEVMQELGAEMDIVMHSDDLALGNVASQLAQAKGELNTILDRAARQGIIRKNQGRVQILNKDEYIKRVGDLPRKIKQLQQQLEPSNEIIPE